MLNAALLLSLCDADGRLVQFTVGFSQIPAALKKEDGLLEYVSLAMSDILPGGLSDLFARMSDRGYELTSKHAIKIWTRAAPSLRRVHCFAHALNNAVKSVSKAPKEVYTAEAPSASEDSTTAPTSTQPSVTKLALIAHKRSASAFKLLLSDLFSLLSHVRSHASVHNDVASRARGKRVVTAVVTRFMTLGIVAARGVSLMPVLKDMSSEKLGLGRKLQDQNAWQARSAQILRLQESSNSENGAGPVIIILNFTTMFDAFISLLGTESQATSYLLLPAVHHIISSVRGALLDRLELSDAIKRRESASSTPTFLGLPADYLSNVCNNVEIPVEGPVFLDLIWLTGLLDALYLRWPFRVSGGLEEVHGVITKVPCLINGQCLVGGTIVLEDIPSVFILSTGLHPSTWFMMGFDNATDSTATLSSVQVSYRQLFLKAAKDYIQERAETFVDQDVPAAAAVAEEDSSDLLLMMFGPSSPSAAESIEQRKATVTMEMQRSFIDQFGRFRKEMNKLRFPPHSAEGLSSTSSASSSSSSSSSAPSNSSSASSSSTSSTPASTPKSPPIINYTERAFVYGNAEPASGDLFFMFREVLSVLPASTAVERLNSHAGQIWRLDRASLSTRNGEAALIASENTKRKRQRENEKSAPSKPICESPFFISFLRSLEQIVKKSDPSSSTPFEPLIQDIGEYSDIVLEKVAVAPTNDRSVSEAIEAEDDSIKDLLEKAGTKSYHGIAVYADGVLDEEAEEEEEAALAPAEEDEEDESSDSVMLATLSSSSSTSNSASSVSAGESGSFGRGQRHKFKNRNIYDSIYWTRLESRSVRAAGAKAGGGEGL